MKNKILQFKNDSLNNNIPIISDEGLELILKNIRDRKIQTVLELGTAVGYSAINMALLGVKVDTIERNQDMYNKALINIDSFSLGERVNVIFADALEYSANNVKYDMIFIDAAKAQYEKMFIKYQNNLSETGIIICDNLNFHHLDPNKVSRHTRQLLKKISLFKEFLANKSDFKTEFFELGDGMSISLRVIK